MEYVVILEEGETSFGAYVPDLPGCVAVGETRDEAMELIREAIELHVESLREN
ncbi:MAG TPA: type II toxin-antitoxin system HicB family antitoxin [Thermoanaerobaculia bacterium]|nr:type II toxin-antitoxin system HicB family antitoxin [Thermoanaerobaculia bacterium]